MVPKYEFSIDKSISEQIRRRTITRSVKRPDAGWNRTAEEEVVIKPKRVRVPELEDSSEEEIYKNVRIGKPEQTKEENEVRKINGNWRGVMDICYHAGPVFRMAHGLLAMDDTSAETRKCFLACVGKAATHAGDKEFCRVLGRSRLTAKVTQDDPMKSHTPKATKAPAKDANKD